MAGKNSQQSKHHKFLWDESASAIDSLEKLKAKEYYDRLFKEYAIGDLRNSDVSKIALRWRTKKDVISGKGEHICGNQSCDSIKDLKSWEVNFKYKEDGKIMNTLVKLRLCRECSIKLNSSKKKDSKYKEVQITKKKQESIKQEARKNIEPDRLQKEFKSDSSVNLTSLDNKTNMNHSWDSISPQSFKVNENLDMESYLADLF